MIAAGTFSGMSFAQKPGEDSTLKSDEMPTTESGPHKLPKLAYAFDALEPYIDEKTMRLHYGKHHKAYIDNLNGAISQEPKLASLTVDDLLRDLTAVPDAARTTIRNNAGGHANHTMFWSIMGSRSKAAPDGELASAISNAFGSFDMFKEKFNEAAGKHFGAGWVFLASGGNGESLEIVTKPNQDTPLMDGKRVILGNDLWEHAFYLKHNDSRTDYLKTWWNVVNWSEVDKRYSAIKAGQRVV